MTKATLSLIIIAVAFGVFWTLDRIKINRVINSIWKTQKRGVKKLTFTQGLK